jgi:foldase protein PrsA
LPKTSPKSSSGIVIAVIVSLAVAGTGGFMVGKRTGEKSASLNDAVVATVNGTKITKTQVYDRLIKTGGATAVDRMIDETLVANAAKAANITVTEKEIDDEIAKIKVRMGGEDAFTAALQQYNLTPQQVRDDQTMRINLSKLLTPGIKLEDAALQKYFEDNKTQFGGNEVTARHILVATEAEAKAIKAQLDAGADFATLAKEKSTEPAAKTSGGDLGTFGPGKMVAEFDAVIFTLKKGEISAPFQSSFGWHVAQVTDIKPPITYDQVKDQVKAAYIDDQVSQLSTTWLADQRKAGKITNTVAAAAPAPAP